MGGVGWRGMGKKRGKWDGEGMGSRMEGDREEVGWRGDGGIGEWDGGGMIGWRGHRMEGGWVGVGWRGVWGKGKWDEGGILQ